LKTWLTERGSAVAKITAENLKEHEKLFHPTLNLWVHEEIVNGEKLSTLINSKKENVKYLCHYECTNRRYLPGVKLPDNIKAVTDIETVAKDADILIFNFPHQVCPLVLS
jgi:glycerol-3-phosphate dehydrogenase (NAD+)